MEKRISIAERITISLLTAIALASCSLAATPATPPTATVLPSSSTSAELPTDTATATATTASTAAPTASAVPSPTEQLTPMANPGMNAYCRKGPGTGYYAITYLHVGTNYPILAQNGLGTWWLVQVSNDISCWMGDSTSVMQGALWKVPIRMVPPLPKTPGTFTAVPTCNSGTQTESVQLRWLGVKNTNGYHLYVNGTLLVTLDPNAAAYNDTSASYAVVNTYEIEAFSDLGASDRAQVAVPSCD